MSVLWEQENAVLLMSFTQKKNPKPKVLISAGSCISILKQGAPVVRGLG